MNYYHELTDAQRESLPLDKIKQEYSKQPDWCKLYMALDYMAGCWGLQFGNVHKDGEDYCKKCEYHQRKVSHERPE